MGGFRLPRWCCGLIWLPGEFVVAVSVQSTQKVKVKLTTFNKKSVSTSENQERYWKCSI